MWFLLVVKSSSSVAKQRWFEGQALPLTRGMKPELFDL